jgi:hypothetical protein
MKIAMITTWNEKCGIAEYSRSLVYALKKQAGVGVYAITKKELIREDEDFVVRDIENPMYLGGYDVVHFQNQGSFWSREDFEDKLRRAKSVGAIVAVTFHDSAIWEGFDFSNIDIAIAHRPEILRNINVENKVIIPMGIEKYPIRLCSFGIGRNDKESVRKICDELGFEYHVLDPDQAWLESDMLNEFLKRYDGMVLWYNDVAISGCSAGIRTAIASRRPIFISMSCSTLTFVLMTSFSTLFNLVLICDKSFFICSKISSIFSSLFTATAPDILDAQIIPIANGKSNR